MTSDTPPRVELGVQKRLDPRFIRVQQLTGWITAAVIAGPGALFVLVMLLQSTTPQWLKLLAACGWLGLTILLVWLAQYWPPISYRYASYVVDEHGIEIRHGVVWRRVTTVPRTRVQHTDVSQGPLERSHGLGTLVIHTAGTEHALVPLQGLDYDDAVALRDHLLPRGAGDVI